MHRLLLLWGSITSHDANMEVGDQEWNREKTSSKMQLGGQFSWKNVPPRMMIWWCQIRSPKVFSLLLLTFNIFSSSDTQCFKITQNVSFYNIVSIAIKDILIFPSNIPRINSWIYKDSPAQQKMTDVTGFFSVLDDIMNRRTDVWHLNCLVCQCSNRHRFYNRNDGG